MLPNQHNIREFPRLRRRLLALEALIVIDSGDASPSRFDRDLTVVDLARVREHEEEAAEIRYVFAHFAGLDAQWSQRAQALFTLGIVIIVVLAMLAAYRM